MLGKKDRTSLHSGRKKWTKIKEHVLLNKEHVLLNFFLTSTLCVCVLWRIGRMRGYFVFFLQR